MMGRGQGPVELEISLPRPHKAQASIRASRAKRKVIVAGRRGGKTTGAAMMAVEAMLRGRRVLEAAPTADQTSAFWDACCKFMAAPIRAGVVGKNDTNRLLRFGEGRIRTKTAWDGDTLRGDHADLLILDEYSLMDRSVWDEVGAPMLLDNDGDAIFIFTPKRRNHAYEHYRRANEDTTGRWGAWHFTSLDNPHLSREALAEITQDMTADAYRQEIMAEFLESSGAVFRNVAACATITEPDKPAAHAGHTTVIGVDWGKSRDYTCLTCFCRECARVVDWDRFNQIDYTYQRGRLSAMWQRWQSSNILPERNSIGDPNIEMLAAEGMPITLGHDLKRGYMTLPTTKPPLIEGLVLAIERGEIRIPADYADELQAYEIDTRQDGRPRYNAPEGEHDDRVISLALAYWAASRAAQVWI